MGHTRKFNFDSNVKAGQNVIEQGMSALETSKPAVAEVKKPMPPKEEIKRVQILMPMSLYDEMAMFKVRNKENIVDIMCHALREYLDKRK